MKFLSALFIALNMLSSQLQAREIIDSEKPRIKNAPKADFEGNKYPRGGIAMHTTTAFRMPDGSITILYGFIIAKGFRKSRSWSVNTAMNLDCRGSTVGSRRTGAKGEAVCHRNGKFWMRTPFDIPAEKYGRLRGTMSMKTTGPNGEIVWSVMSWKGSGFPDAAPLISALEN